MICAGKIGIFRETCIRSSRNLPQKYERFSQGSSQVAVGTLTLSKWKLHIRLFTCREYREAQLTKDRFEYFSGISVSY